MGAVAATLIAVMNPEDKKILENEMDTMTFTDNITRYGFSYFKDHFNSIRTRHSDILRDVRVIMGSGDPVLHYIHKYIKAADYSVPTSNSFAP